MIRAPIVALLTIAATPLAAQTAAVPATEAPLRGGSDFISPMGEPFRSTDQLSGAEHWFRTADTDHDGRLTLAEMRADADRFFVTLDTDKDGLIGPDELEHYETEVAPEIRVASTFGDPSRAKQNSDGTVVPPPYPTRLGAGRFGYIDTPEPVVAADMNMDRAVGRAEFAATAERRFKLLDPEGSGAITRPMLPTLDRSVSAKPKKGRRRGRD